MSKKKTKSKQESVAAEVVPVAVAEEVKTPMFKPDQLDPMLGIADAATRHIDKYQPRWLQPLKKYAKDCGLDPESQQSVSTWKHIFSKWGAIVK